MAYHAQHKYVSIIDSIIYDESHFVQIGFHFPGKLREIIFLVNNKCQEQ